MKLNYLFVMLFMLIFIGCDKNTMEDQANNQVLENFKNKGFMVLHGDDGTYLPGGFSSKMIKEFENQIDYETALINYSTDNPVTVDFMENQVLLVDMGEKPSLGYAVEVSSVEENENSTTVNILYTIPSKNDCPVADAISNPYQFILIAGTKPLIIREEQEEYCT